MRGFKLTQFEMLDTILASDKEFIEALMEFSDPALGRVNWFVAK